ncbi:hypothetical protein [Pseudokineococcus lusitanus]|uniref:Uncharacterized protein n=1 Tax=Pseudokineococcus lusitanus TaxID=763993 RepID=A0A3N1HU50_9ACTN|nr:hypothetical protein [Pseudokineococcus lusitanus]ROP45950.1 hypothetical protein EDC03_0566 [Pseudokineococcus lusitanus]
MATLTLTMPSYNDRLWLTEQPRWLTFLGANDLDPNDVVASVDGIELSVVVDEDAATLTATCFVHDAAGHRQIDPAGTGSLKEQRTVPLRSHPRDHALA